MADYQREVFWQGVRQIDTDIYERCWFRVIPCQDAYPEFEFEVREENGKTNQLIHIVTVRLTADEELWEYIEEHPLWQKDPRLLLLMTVYDVFWSVKIIPVEVDNPFQSEITIKPLQGGTVYVKIRVELLIDFGGVTVISVVNYANTHVRDQVDAVMKDNPAARPTDAYIKSVKERFYNDRIDAKRIKKKQQRRRLKLRKRSHVRHERVQIFIDESGDIGYKSLQEPYILSAYILPISAVQVVENELKQVLRRHWQNPPQEIHFNKIPASKLASVQSEVAQCLLSSKGNCISVIGHKPGFLSYLLRCEAESRKTEEKPIVTNWAYLLNESPTGLARATLILILEELLFHLGTETLDLQTPMEIFHDMKHRSWMNEALKTAFQRSRTATKSYAKEIFGQDLPLSRTFQLVESLNQPCLWIPDWISWELGKWYRGQKWSHYFESCFERLSFITFGQVEGKILIERPEGKIVSAFPDVPRQIASI